MLKSKVCGIPMITVLSEQNSMHKNTMFVILHHFPLNGCNCQAGLVLVMIKTMWLNLELNYLLKHCLLSLLSQCLYFELTFSSPQLEILF